PWLGHGVTPCLATVALAAGAADDTCAREGRVRPPCGNRRRGCSDTGLGRIAGRAPCRGSAAVEPANADATRLRLAPVRPDSRGHSLLAIDPDHARQRLAPRRGVELPHR